MRIRPINKFLKFFLGKNVIGITLCPFGIYIENTNINILSVKYTINHEKIHWQQQIELLIIPFYILYIFEFFIKGYDNISFEREAYANDKNLNYLKNRKRFSWIKYFKK